MTLPSVRSIGMKWLVASALVLAACGSDDGEGSESSGGGTGGGGNGSAASSNGGGTPQPTCGVSTCEVGQHCNNLLCVDGCLTDANCGAEQTCADIDADTKIGTCRNAPVAPMKDCDALCEKAEACMDPLAPMCMDLCVAASAACVTCLVESNCDGDCDAHCG
jgi:hypothetical protein